MKQIALIIALAFGLTATAASAACVAEYKAKQDNPLRLDYGTITVPGEVCSVEDITPAVQADLASRGWVLLSILSVRKAG